MISDKNKGFIIAGAGLAAVFLISLLSRVPPDEDSNNDDDEEFGEVTVWYGQQGGDDSGYWNMKLYDLAKAGWMSGAPIGVVDTEIPKNFRTLLGKHFVAEVFHNSSQSSYIEVIVPDYGEKVWNSGIVGAVNNNLEGMTARLGCRITIIRYGNPGTMTLAVKEIISGNPCFKVISTIHVSSYDLPAGLVDGGYIECDAVYQGYGDVPVMIDNIEIIEGPFV